MDISNDGMLICIQTTKVIALIKILTMMHDAGFFSCTIIFKQHNKNGKIIKNICIEELNVTRKILVRISLPAENFDHYFCAEPKVIILVKLSLLIQSLKKLDCNNLLMFVKHECKNKIFFNNIFGITCQILDNDHLLKIPKIKFISKIIIKTETLNSMYHVLLSEDRCIIRITSIKHLLIFSNANDSNLNITTSYHLPDLMHFGNCSLLCKNTELYYNKYYPLVQAINICGLGKMYIFFVPINKN